jgi:hypothetical protein
MEHFLAVVQKEMNKSLTNLCYGKNSYKPEGKQLIQEVLSSLKNQDELILKFVNNDKDKCYFLEKKSNKFKATIVINLDNSLDVFFRLTETYKSKVDGKHVLKTLEDVSNYVYFVKSKFGYKIGKTKSIKKRLKIFEVKLPFDIELFAFIETKKMTECELFFHKIFEDKRIGGEWFDLKEEEFKEIEILGNNWGKFNYSKK